MELGVLTDFALGEYHMSTVAGQQPGRTRVSSEPPLAKERSQATWWVSERRGVSGLDAGWTLLGQV